MSQVVRGTAPAVATAKFQGAGVSEITTGKGSAYLIRQPVPKKFTHKTGPSVAPDAKVKRTLCIFNGRFPGDPTMAERKLLHKKSYLSHLYHYEYEDQEDAPLAERHLKYIREDAQVSAGNLIDTESKAVPEIPHGPVSPKTFRSLQREVKGLEQDGVIVFKDIESDWEGETPENKRNLKEAHENLLKSPKLMRAKLNPLSKYYKKDRSDPMKPFIRDKWNKIARAHLADLGVADAEFFEVHSVHLVDDAAHRFHLDLLGLGPSALVVVLETDEPYHVLFAAVKQGDCPKNML